MSGFWGSGWLRGLREPLRAPFGRLEREVMDVVWEGGELPVRDVQARLARRVAYTTVMTTLDRLFKKGFVTRRREGRAFLYTAALGRLEIEASLTASLLSGVLGGEDDAARPFLSNLVDAVGNRNGRLLDELERLVRDKRQQLRKERE